MSASPTNLGFPRKVVACYLMFSLAMLCWLGGAVLMISHEIVNKQSCDSSLASLRKTASAIEMSYLRHGQQNLQQQVISAHNQPFVEYATVIGIDGVVLAHSDVSLVGSPEVKPQGSLLTWENVQGIRFTGSEGRQIQEYHVPLMVNSKQIGTLKIAFGESSLLATLHKLDKYAPLVLLIPLVFVAIGGKILWTITSSHAQIDAQLRSLALQSPHAKLTPQKLKTRSASALGWNRLIAALADSENKTSGSEIEKRLADAAASRNENEMAEVLQNLSDGIVLTDPEGKITFANRAISALLGTDDEHSLQGTMLGERLLDELPELDACPLFDPQCQNRQVVSEAQRQEGDSQRVLRVSRQPLVGESFKGLVWSLRDVTQQKLADQMRDQFIDTATHELRTPLSNIKAYAEMLATSKNIEVEQQKEFCNTINSEVTRLARFVDDLLSISSMEVGSLSADRQKTDTARLFEEVLAKVQPLMDQKDQQFEVRLPEKMRVLNLDKEKMVAVLVNLLGNAAKYTPESGHVAMKVKLDDESLEIAIEDTGVGISEEELPHVFDKFFRSSDSRVQDEVGTGLGLSLAREVVRMHGGDITVESTLDKGSTFLVTIPLE